jgi:hypothetical protein
MGILPVCNVLRINVVAHGRNFRWHHMTITLHLNPQPVPTGFSPPRAGFFLLGSIATSIAAPLAFVLLLFSHIGCSPKPKDPAMFAQVQAAKWRSQ